MDGIIAYALAKKYCDSHGGGGTSAVTSVNGKIGKVVLSASDVGAATSSAVTTISQELSNLQEVKKRNNIHRLFYYLFDKTRKHKAS